MRKKLIMGLVILLLVFSTVAIARAQRGSRTTVERMSVEDLKDSIISMLAQMLKDPDKTIRIYAIKGLTNIKDVDEDELRVIGPLFDTLRDTDSEVRKEAAKALDKIFGEEK
ncbi:MAG: HEAT repeat domain-containing protein [Candidatus Omnitrophica bacterium]|nr:HEAT repeat domain-containing protein [Candidatus Omnitrophota bacterium]